jgi:hypothetical protein
MLLVICGVLLLNVIVYLVYAKVIAPKKTLRSDINISSI